MTHDELVRRAKEILADAYEEAAMMVALYLEKRSGESLQGLCKEIDPDNWNALRHRVQGAQASRKANAGDDSARLARNHRIERAKTGLRQSSPKEIAELLDDPDIRRNVAKAQDLAHRTTEERSQRRQREAIGEETADALDEQQLLIDAEAKAFAARRELRDMLHILNQANIADARESWQEDFLKTLDDLDSRVSMARGLVEGQDLDAELAKLLAGDA